MQPCHQATLLTVVALARRVFFGGVFVTGSLDVPTAVPGCLAPTLREAIEELGGSIAGARPGVLFQPVATAGIEAEGGGGQVFSFPVCKFSADHCVYHSHSRDCVAGLSALNVNHFDLRYR